MIRMVKINPTGHLAFMLALACLGGMPASAQDAFAWIERDDGKVLVNAAIVSLDSSALHVIHDGRAAMVLLSQISKIRVFESSSLLSHAVLGAAAGFGVGAAVGSLGARSSSDEWNPVTTGIYLGIAGGIIGAVAGSHDRGDLMDLRSSGPAEQYEILSEELRRSGVAVPVR